jgi:hypothetical protein
MGSVSDRCSTASSGVRVGGCLASAAITHTDALSNDRTEAVKSGCRLVGQGLLEDSSELLRGAKYILQHLK